MTLSGYMSYVNFVQILINKCYSPSVQEAFRTEVKTEGIMLGDASFQPSHLALVSHVIIKMQV